MTDAGMVAAYASVDPTKAIEYVARPRTDRNYPIRAVQGLGMAPDAMRLLKAVRVKMPDMAWKIDGEIKAIQDREKARAEGRPENPGLVELEARRQAQKEAAEKAREGKTPGDYQGFDDWFADLSGADRRKVDKAAHHFLSSVYAIDLASVTPAQRATVFKLAHAGLHDRKHALRETYAGPILVASASADNTDELLAMIEPDKRMVHLPLAALIRSNPAEAERVLLKMEKQTFRPSPIRNAVKLVPAEAIVVLEKTGPKLKTKGVRDFYDQLLADLKKTHAE